MKKILCFLLAVCMIVPLWACENKSGNLWDKKDTLPTSGNWKLGCNVTLKSAVTVSKDLILDLNGYKVTRRIPKTDTENQHAITVAEGASLTLKDSGKKGVMTATFERVPRVTSPAVLILGKENSSIVIESGTYDCSNAESLYTEAFGGAIVTDGKLTINGGKILGYRNYATSDKTEEEVEDPKELLVPGGGTTIAGWEHSQIVINGGEFIGGGCKANSGGVIASCGNLTINGGKFSLDDELTGGYVVAPNGGIIYMEKADANTLAIHGGTFTGGNVIYNGGVIWTQVPTLITGGTFNGAQAFYGGIIMADDCELTIDDGDFVGPGGKTHDESGGLVYSNGAKLTLNGGNFKGGAAVKFGANIYYLRAGGEMVIAGDTYINGGFTIHGTEDGPVKLTIKDQAVIDNTDAAPKAPWNIRMRNTLLYLGDSTEPSKVAGKDNTDVSLTYDDQGVVNGFIDGMPK